VLFVGQDKFVTPSSEIDHIEAKPAPQFSIMLDAEEITEIIAALKMRAADKRWFEKSSFEKIQLAKDDAAKDRAKKSHTMYSEQLNRIKAQIDNFTTILASA